MTSSYSPGHDTLYIDVCRAADTAPSLKNRPRLKLENKAFILHTERRITLKEIMLKARKGNKAGALDDP